ncbi:hypothetical protein EAF04_005320 [Stromatinia cepivora]|nr:hypothetical protein EAF04_005320 [Stromatinia cepivora]
MPPVRTAKSTNNRVLLYQRIKESGLIMSPCSRCAARGLECRVLEDSRRCGECIRANGSGKCDVFGPSASDWEALDREERRIEQELREALSKQLRLLTQQRSLRSRAGEMLRRGLKTLDELDEAEEKERLEKERMEKEKSDSALSAPAEASSNVLDDFDPSSFLSPSDTFWGNLGVDGENAQSFTSS